MQSIRLAFAMFSKIPMGNPEWNEKNMRYMMYAFPLVGIVIGAAVLAWMWLCGVFALSNPLRALGMTLIPVAVTGGIHLDGLCDTCDALASNASPEKRREILKDPRAGAFGVIGVVIYLLSYFALAMSLPERRDWRGAALIAFGFVISRVMSAQAVLGHSGLPVGEEGLVKSFRDAAPKTKGGGLPAAVSAGVMFGLVAVISGSGWGDGSIIRGLVLFAGALILAASLTRTAKKKFGAMSGDLAGWFLQRCELWILAAVALTPVWHFLGFVVIIILRI